ncbi:hypothetical protein LINPERPRIM_LOCUS40532, partial [Linum perenne]
MLKSSLVRDDFQMDRQRQGRMEVWVADLKSRSAAMR